MKKYSLLILSFIISIIIFIILIVIQKNITDKDSLKKVYILKNDLEAYSLLDESCLDEIYIENSLLTNYEFISNKQEILNKNPHKEIKNILNNYLPQKVISFILKNIDPTIKACNINGKTRDLILNRIHNFEIEVINTNRGEETVTAGGIDLKEINPKTMELKKVENLYAIGEVLNIDGFCGGFNLQNAWSTAFVCAESFK